MNNEIDIRNYTFSDQLSVLNLFQKNVPLYFSEKEANDLKHYLENDSTNYFLVIVNQTIIGCGGYNILENKKEVRISWDFFNPAFTGKGFGSQLLNFRIKRIENDFPDYSLVVRTSQHAYTFYEKHGFRLMKIEKDYWDIGFDLYFMQK